MDRISHMKPPILQDTIQIFGVRLRLANQEQIIRLQGVQAPLNILTRRHTTHSYFKTIQKEENWLPLFWQSVNVVVTRSTAMGAISARRIAGKPRILNTADMNSFTKLMSIKSPKWVTSQQCKTSWLYVCMYKSKWRTATAVTCARHVTKRISQYCWVKARSMHTYC